MPIFLKHNPVVISKGKVIVVGGGIMGASAAWHLSKAGASVTASLTCPQIYYGTDIASRVKALVLCGVQ